MANPRAASHSDAEASEVNEEIVSTMAAALKQLWKFAIRLHIDTENVMGKTSIATPMLNEEIIRLRFERGRLDEMEGEGDLPVLAQYLATMLELAAVTGDQLKECSQYADRSVFPNSVVTEYVTSFRFTEVDDAFRKSAIEGEYDGLKRACGDSLFEKIFAKKEQQGWMPGDMSRISRQRFEGGYRLLSRLAYDIDSTGYVLGFLVDPENPARLYEVMNETPPKSWGFTKGDIVQEINGISVDSFESMKKILLAQKEKQVTVTVLRDRKPKQLRVDARKWM
ncbi:PDZ domain-containing protein [bacterium]|nr:MAG: PDZ domain-containing protein [bacterium]